MGLTVTGLGRGIDACDVLRLHHGKDRRLGPIPVRQVSQHAAGHGPDTGLQKDVGGPVNPRLGQLVRRFPGQGGVSLDNPGGNLLIAGPAGVLDKSPPLLLGLLGRIAHRVVIAQRQNPCLHRACVQNGLRPGRGGARREIDMGLTAQLPGRPGHPPPVVSVGGGHKHHIPDLFLHRRSL